MPTRRQRRRRAKEQRHDYVWEDAEGKELSPEDLASVRTGGQPGTAKALEHSARERMAPSWRRTFKRGLIFAPIMFVTVMLLSNNLTLSQQILQTVLLVAIFIPFSYFIDGVFYRSHKKRAARREQAGSRRGS